MSKGKLKRVVALADLHCGNRVGLTPPAWQLNAENDYDAKYYQIQHEMWKWYEKTIESLRPIHLCLALGDLVDGKSPRADSRDTHKIKDFDQVNMATYCLEILKAENYNIVYGTRYHVSDLERFVAQNLNAKIGAHDWPEVYNIVFDIKHNVGSSATPHGRLTALMRADLWNALWAEAGRQPRCDILLRAHVHYHMEGKRMVGAKEKRFMTLPALQGIGSEYGAEQCEGLIDNGLVCFDIYPDGYEYEVHAPVLKCQIATTTKY